MNKMIKRKLIGAIICCIIGIACLIILIANSAKFSEELEGYMSGFSSGIIIVGIAILIKYTRAMKNEKMSKNEKNKEKTREYGL